MLPHDLPDLLGEDALLHPAVRANGARGIRPSFFVDSPAGRRFVKVTDPDTSPHLEPAVSRIFGHLGVPHVPVEYAFRGGRHLTSAPMIQGKSLLQLTPPETKSIPHDTIAKTMFGEWLAAVGDRHGGNYMTHPEHGIVSIDHGMALSPDASSYHGQHDLTDFNHHSIVRDTTATSENPENSDLWTYARNYGKLSPGHEIPKETLARALAHEPQIEQHIATAVSGLPPKSKEATLEAFRLRMKHLKEHLAEHKKLRVADLFDLHQKVINDAFAKTR